MTKLQLFLSTVLVLLVISVPFIASAVNGIGFSGTATGTRSGADGQISVMVNEHPLLYGPSAIQELIDRSLEIALPQNTAVCSQGGTTVPPYDPLNPVHPWLWVTPEERTALLTEIERAQNFVNLMPNFGWFVSSREYDRRTTPPSYNLPYNEDVNPVGVPIGEGAWTMWDDFNPGFVPGETFTLNLDITGNTGFNAMFITLELPEQITFLNATSPLPHFIVGNVLDNGRRIVMGWPGTFPGGGFMSGNFTEDGRIIDIELQVSSALAAPVITRPITFSVRNRFICEPPTRIDVNNEQVPVDIEFFYTRPGQASEFFPSTDCTCMHANCDVNNPLYQIGGVLIRPTDQRWFLP